MQEFINMGGYAFYVWTSFALGLVSVIYLYFSAKNLHTKKLKEVSLWNAREAQRNNKQVNSVKTTSI